MKVLVVEDNLDLAEILVESFIDFGAEADSVAEGESALTKLTTDSYDCLILDLMLPGMDGMEVLERLRERGNDVPVIVLSARDDVETRIEALNIGADDYVVKPFEMRELLARAGALARRTSRNVRTVLRCGGLEIDPMSRECFIGGELTKLRRREFDILELLMRHENQVFSREQIIAKIWRKEYDGNSNVVDVHVKYLRDRLRPIGLEKALITVRGVGYKMVCPCDKEKGKEKER